MKLNLHFLEAEGSLSAWYDELGAQAVALVERIDSVVPAQLRHHHVDAVIQYLPSECIEGVAMGGSCFRRGLVTINLDPEAECFRDNLLQGVFRRTLAHELHHAMRWGACGYGLALGEALVSEGLADVFCAKVSGTVPPPWVNALDPTDWPALLHLVEQEVEREDYDHGLWFFGTGDLPRWTGYTIGYHLARFYAQKNPNAAATGMVDVPAQTVFSAWNALKAGASGMK